MNLLNVNHLYNVLLSCVDMKIQNTIVVSQTTRGPISFGEKLLKYNPNGYTLVHKGEIMFDPLNNFKQAQILFSIFLKYQEEEEGLYTQIFYDEKDPRDETKTRMFMKTNLGDFSSNYYYNISLGYIELIFKLSGIMVSNLSMFDAPIITEETRRRRPSFPQRDLF